MPTLERQSRIKGMPRLDEAGGIPSDKLHISLLTYVSSADRRRQEITTDGLRAALKRRRYPDAVIDKTFSDLSFEGRNFESAVTGARQRLVDAHPPEHRPISRERTLAVLLTAQKKKAMLDERVADISQQPYEPSLPVPVDVAKLLEIENGRELPEDTMLQVEQDREIPKPLTSPARPRRNPRELLHSAGGAALPRESILIGSSSSSGYANREDLLMMREKPLQVRRSGHKTPIAESPIALTTSTQESQAAPREQEQPTTDVRVTLGNTSGVVSLSGPEINALRRVQTGPAWAREAATAAGIEPEDAGKFLGRLRRRIISETGIDVFATKKMRDRTYGGNGRNRFKITPEVSISIDTE